MLWTSVQCIVLYLSGVMVRSYDGPAKVIRKKLARFIRSDRHKVDLFILFRFDSIPKTMPVENSNPTSSAGAPRIWHSSGMSAGDS